MNVWKTLIAGALALGASAIAQGEASARPMTPPVLVQATVTPAVAATSEAVAPTCQYYRHHWHPGYGWHRRGYGRPYGFYHPHRWHRSYGYYRPYGFHHRHGWRRHYGW